MTLVIYVTYDMNFEYRGDCNVFFASDTTFGPLDGLAYTWNFTSEYPYYGNKSFSLAYNRYYNLLFTGVKLALGVSKNPEKEIQFAYHSDPSDTKGFIMEIQKSDFLNSDGYLEYYINVRYLSLNITIMRNDSIETYQALKVENQTRVVKELNSSFYSEFYIAMLTIEYTLSMTPRLSFYLDTLNWTPYTIELNPLNVTISIASTWDVSFVQFANNRKYEYEFKGELQNILLSITQTNSTTVNINMTEESQLLDSGRFIIEGRTIPYMLTLITFIIGSITLLTAIKIKFITTQMPSKKVVPVVPKKKKIKK